MRKREAVEYRALISNRGDVLRGRIPARLVRHMKARDYMVFREDEAGRMTVSLSRTRGAAHQQVKRGRSCAAKRG
jgi:hypothetical protein